MNIIKNRINNVRNAIKKRILNTKNNRIYIQDSELIQTVFKPGEKYDFKFIKHDGSMLKIFIDGDGKRIVSKRKRKNYINPVIDIRNRDILDRFKGYSKIEIEIYKNEILVRGIADNKENLLNVSQNNIIRLGSKSKVNNEIVFSKKFINDFYIKNVANGYEQIRFNLFNECNKLETVNISTKYNVESIENYTNDINASLRFVSLFSGIGALDYGFINQKFKPQIAIEIEKDMVKTYNYNLGNYAVQCDLNEYDINKIPDAEILIGGSPCQDLSNSNRRTGKKVLDSPKNKLIRKYIEVAKSMKSLKVFVLENVTQLITKGKQFLEEIINELSDFEITVNKVNSINFGSAQYRERAIIIGSKIGKIKLKEPCIKLYKSVKQAFEGLTDNTPNQLDYSKPKKETLFKMSFVKPGGNFKDIPEEYRGNGCHSNLFKRLEWNKPSITITNPRKSNILHPEENRILSLRECARLFDLPDNFKLLGRLSNMQQAIANSVPYNLSRAIAIQIKEAFERQSNKNILI